MDIDMVDLDIYPNLFLAHADSLEGFKRKATFRYLGRWTMAESTTSGSSDTFDMGSMFRTSARMTFVIQIISVIVMLGSVAAYYIGGFLPSIDPDIQILLVLVGVVITIVVFLAAFGLFVRFSRRIGNAVVGPGLQEVRMDTPRVKTVIYTYGILVAMMAITGLYTWYLVDKNFLVPWAASLNSVSLRIFGLALGAFVIALLIQIIIAAVGRMATKVVIEVLDIDDSEFLE
ncbi:MAG: hypothetical protein ACTSVD_00120 [Candidatus Thorarchaeota archaeon]|nr:MAG: hypothetical protein DRO93_06665 [Candidatus Thorarchaeota archaeon]